MIKLITFILLISINIGISAQCVTNVDLNTWSKKGPTAAGTWAVSGGGTSVFQSINGAPTFFVNPQDLINVEVTGQFGVRNGVGDDDFIGFVIGLKEPSSTNSDYDFFLFDWQRQTPYAGKPNVVNFTEVKGTSAQCNLWAKTATAPGVVNILQNSNTHPAWDIWNNL